MTIRHDGELIFRADPTVMRRNAYLGSKDSFFFNDFGSVQAEREGVSHYLDIDERPLYKRVITTLEMLSQTLEGEEWSDRYRRINTARRAALEIAARLITLPEEQVTAEFRSLSYGQPELVAMLQGKIRSLYQGGIEERLSRLRGRGIQVYRRWNDTIQRRHPMYVVEEHSILQIARPLLDRRRIEWPVRLIDLLDQSLTSASRDDYRSLVVELTRVAKRTLTDSMFTFPTLCTRDKLFNLLYFMEREDNERTSQLLLDLSLSIESAMPPDVFDATDGGGDHRLAHHATIPWRMLLHLHEVEPDAIASHTAPLIAELTLTLRRIELVLGYESDETIKPKGDRNDFPTMRALTQPAVDRSVMTFLSTRSSFYRSGSRRNAPAFLRTISICGELGKRLSARESPFWKKAEKVRNLIAHIERGEVWQRLQEVLQRPHLFDAAAQHVSELFSSEACSVDAEGFQDEELQTLLDRLIRYLGSPLSLATLDRLMAGKDRIREAIERVAEWNMEEREALGHAIESLPLSGKKRKKVMEDMKRGRDVSSPEYIKEAKDTYSHMPSELETIAHEMKMFPSEETLRNRLRPFMGGVDIEKWITAWNNLHNRPAPSDRIERDASAIRDVLLALKNEVHLHLREPINPMVEALRAQHDLELTGEFYVALFRKWGERLASELSYLQHERQGALHYELHRTLLECKTVGNELQHAHAATERDGSTHYGRSMGLTGQIFTLLYSKKGGSVPQISLLEQLETLLDSYRRGVV